MKSRITPPTFGSLVLLMLLFFSPIVTQAEELVDDAMDVALDFGSSDVDVIDEDDMEEEEFVLEDDALITVNYPDEPIRRILRNVADLYDINLVIPDTLVGNASIKLRDVNWRQVFEIVLKPVGFTYDEDRNVVRVVSIDEIEKEPMELRTFPIKYAKAADILLSLKPIIAADGAGGSLEFDERSNSLIARARPSALNEVEQLLRTSEIDKPALQVMIETKFVEVTTEKNPDTKSDDVGFDWWTGKALFGAPDRGFLQIKGMLDLFSSAAGSSFETVILSTNEYLMTLKALETTNKSNLLGSPTIVTSNNKAASFHVGKKQPIIEANFDTTTGNFTVGEVEYLDVGVRLDVTPRVNSGADQITLQVKPEVSRIIDNVQFGGDSSGIISYPVRTIRTVETNVNIKNGYTLALGGLLQDDDIKRTKKVPVLGDLPFVGRIFQQKQHTQEKINLIMFITAKTLDPEGATYHEVVDPRQIAKMGVTDADIPGYANGVEMPGMEKMSEQHRQLLMELQQKRNYCYDKLARRDVMADKLGVCAEPKKKSSWCPSRSFGHSHNFRHQYAKKSSHVGRGF